MAVRRRGAQSFLQLLATIMILVACLPAVAATKIDLNSDWRFRIDPQNSGADQGWVGKIPDQSDEVSLPHTWSVGKYSAYEGTAWYFKTFPADTALRGRLVELHFGATFYKSRVWINGHLLGEHEGGYTEYYFDITPYLQAQNTIAVAINNQPGVDTIPGADLKAGPNARIYDWWPWGGIVRGAWLRVSGDNLLRWQHIDTTVESAAAQVTDRVAVENHTPHPENLTLRVAIFGEEGSVPVATAEKAVTVSPGSTEAVIDLTIPAPHLWDLDNPYLYSVVCTISDNRGAVVDSITDNIGVRTIQIKDRHLYVNGHQVRLSGLARHEDSPWEGLAETRGTMLHDYDDMKALQTTITRPVHYPQNPFIYDYADRNGILMIPEIPMWQFSEEQMTNPKVIALAKQMFTEMVTQNYNHPSIFAWSTDNESATDTPGGIAYFKTMYALSKNLNPQRFVTFADDRIAFVDPAANASRLADFIMWNEYFGTWDGPDSQLSTTIVKIRKGYPDKMVLVSEFGTPGIYASDAKAGDELRVKTIREQMAVFAKQDWIAGAILWCYQDYTSYHNLRTGQPDHYVDHGVVDQNRQRKPSFYVWQQVNEPAHIDLHWEYDADGTPAGFNAVIARRSIEELPSYPLTNYRLSWILYDADGKQVTANEMTLPEIEASQVLRGSWKSASFQGLRLYVRLYRPRGFLAQQEQLDWQVPTLGAFRGSGSGR